MSIGDIIYATPANGTIFKHKPNSFNILFSGSASASTVRNYATTANIEGYSFSNGANIIMSLRKQDLLEMSDICKELASYV